ncbi:hypothetical protein [Catenulispora pinisilvae]|uniref:hypothetical protein n=1 Tax=Catenulispora pinisilvae TaxID=2705253 RepID=UPI00189104AE|nr:hypothetical protein [Catenulispora pinisilvae]
MSAGATDPARREPLALEVPGYQTGKRQTRWADGKRRKIEDVLAVLFEELELQAGQAAQRKIDEQQAEDERRQQWQAAMAKAREAATLAFYIKTLEKQHKQWREAERLREYLAAVDARVAQAVADEDPGVKKAQEWMIFVKAYIMTLDPLSGLPTMPDPPALTNDDLKPFLGRWSPYGPG